LEELFNPWEMAPKDRNVQTKTFQDIGVDGEPCSPPFTMVLWRTNDTEDTKASELAESLIAQYVGYPDMKPPVEPTMEFPAVGGEAVDVTETMCRNAAVFESAQPPFSERYYPKGTRRFSADEIIAIRARLDISVRTEMSNFLRSVNATKKKAETSKRGKQSTGE